MCVCVFIMFVCVFIMCVCVFIMCVCVYHVCVCVFIMCVCVCLSCACVCVYIMAVVGLMDRALDLKPEVTQGVRIPAPTGSPQSCTVGCPLINTDGLNAENTFHSSLYSV